jgi:uncharacterized small protein (DUF1192 family)
MNINDLSVEELGAYRDQLQAEIENLRAKYRDAGLLIEQKRNETKTAELNAEIARLKKEKAALKK